jgi:hypothetical protein
MLFVSDHSKRPMCEVTVLIFIHIYTLPWFVDAAKQLDERNAKQETEVDTVGDDNEVSVEDIQKGRYGKTARKHKKSFKSPSYKHGWDKHGRL